MFHDAKYTHLHIHVNHKALLPNSKLLHKECFMMPSTLIYTCTAVIKLYYQIHSYSQGMCHDAKYTHTFTAVIKLYYQIESYCTRNVLRCQHSSWLHIHGNHEAFTKFKVTAQGMFHDAKYTHTFTAIIKLYCQISQVITRGMFHDAKYTHTSTPDIKLYC